jgi:sterol desaturase/sphingolipid hydroxylase (fatty acid hydroxylase superfamily)
MKADVGRINGERKNVMVEIAEILSLACIPTFIIWDQVSRFRKFSAPKFWKLRATIVSAVNFFLSTYVILLWGNLLEGFSILDGRKLGVLGGALVGILVYELVHYWYHRAAHEVDLLWRWAHQAHHSAESIDALGAYYQHPIDAFFFASWSVLVFFPLLGLQPAAGAIAAAFLTFNAMLQHANIKTPRWLGFIVQRPESHCIHHERGVHRFNYSDLPLWDILFGTFRNPGTWQGEAGFYKGASSRIWDMLLGRDVSTPTVTAEPTHGRQEEGIAA